MRLNPTAEELLAFEIVERELNVDVDPTGERHAPNQVDAILTYRAGPRHSAALEITRVCSQPRVEAWSRLRKDQYQLTDPGLKWWWMVGMPPTVRYTELKKRLPGALKAFEDHGVTRPIISQVSPLWNNPDVQWYLSNRISANGYPDTVADGSTRFRAPGAVTIVLSALGGFQGEADAIPAWISAELASSPQLRGKLEKLQQSGQSEQHLFLFLEHEGAPFAVVEALAGSMDVPTRAPEVEPITHLWLFSTEASVPAFLRWSAAEGWRRIPTHA